MMELLKQDQYSPMLVEKQVVVLFLGVEGYLDDIPIEQIRAFEVDFLKFMDTEGADVLASIRNEKELTDDTAHSLIKLIKEFKTTFVVK